jgi:hypothetical protein
MVIPTQKHAINKEFSIYPPGQCVDEIARPLPPAVASFG